MLGNVIKRLTSAASTLAYEDDTVDYLPGRASTRTTARGR